MIITVEFEVKENPLNIEKPLIKFTFTSEEMIEREFTLNYGSEGHLVFDIKPLVKELRFRYKD